MSDAEPTGAAAARVAAVRRRRPGLLAPVLGLCAALLPAFPLLAAEADQPAATDGAARAAPPAAEPGTISASPAAPAAEAAPDTRGVHPQEVRIFDWVNRTFTAGRDLSVLGAPSDNAEPIGRVREGVPVFVVGVVAGGNWLQLRLPDGATIGYVPAADFPAVLGQPAAPPTTAAQPASPAPPPTAAQPPQPPQPIEAAAPAAAEAVISGHPRVVDTATLAIGDHLVSLYGIVGLDGQAAAGLQQYIDGSGDSVTCREQGEARHICLLPNNTDVAMAALINGAALLGPEAPETYVAERNEAVRSRRGMWGDCGLPAFAPPTGLSPELLQAYMARLAVNPLYAVEALGEDGWLIDGVPYALIDGGFRAVAFDAGRGGWGFRDREGRWRDAPDRLRADLDRRHPRGEGLRHEAGIRGEGVHERERGHEGREFGGHGREAGERGGREHERGREAGRMHEGGGFGGHGFTQPHAGGSFHAMGGGGHSGGGGRGGGGRKNR